MRTLRTCRDLGLEPTHEGKVRDVFDLGDRLLLVATDRISAYDVVMPNPIPGKGILLTQMTLAWYDFLGGDVSEQLITDSVEKFPERFRGQAAALAGRSMLVRKAGRLDVECIVRGYLAGSGWREYRATGTVGGLEVSDGLRESDRFDAPLFTPTTKAEEGHDEGMSHDEVISLVGRRAFETMRARSIDYYLRALEHAMGRGIIIADTKFEFGLLDGHVVLIDEMLSPDSSRFWPADDYEPGRTQRAFDKQFLRDYLDELGWDHTPPAPELPLEIVERTRSRYVGAMERLFGADRLATCEETEVGSP